MQLQRQRLENAASIQKVSVAALLQRGVHSLCEDALVQSAALIPFFLSTKKKTRIQCVKARKHRNDWWPLFLD